MPQSQILAPVARQHFSIQLSLNVYDFILKVCSIVHLELGSVQIRRLWYTHARRYTAMLLVFVDTLLPQDIS